ncbi:MAG: nuclear transport factor 2 family protein [Actinobacteria bacterium]|nr:nuclear transport factor 2 family protein [Actinomycetota bacterium]
MTDLADAQRRLGELVDRQQLADLPSRLGMLLDEGRFAELASVFTADVVTDFPDFGGAHLDSLDALIAFAGDMPENFDSVQHLIANVVVLDLDADRATMRANLVWWSTYSADDPTDYWVVGSVYRFQAVRTEVGWRLSRMELSGRWSDGRAPDFVQTPPQR